MKIPCSLIRDILPLYAENMVEPETKSLVDEHLSECNECSIKLSEIKSAPTSQIETTKPLINLKKQIRKRRIFTAIIAALCATIVVFTCFYHENSAKLIPWKEGLVNVRGIENVPYEKVNDGIKDDLEKIDNLDEVEALALDINSIANGTDTIYSSYNGINIIQCWSNGANTQDLAKDYNEMYLYPVPESLIYGYNGDQKLLWGNQLNGGVEILPRLALSFYFKCAIALATLFGVAWIVFRKKKLASFARQLFFAPFSYIIAHLLVKGLAHTSFFMEKDLFAISIIAISIYIVLSLSWQLFLQRDMNI